MQYLVNDQLGFQVGQCYRNHLLYYSVCKKTFYILSNINADAYIWKTLVLSQFFLTQTFFRQLDTMLCLLQFLAQYPFKCALYQLSIKKNRIYEYIYPWQVPDPFFQLALVICQCYINDISAIKQRLVRYLAFKQKFSRISHSVFGRIFNQISCRIFN